MNMNGFIEPVIFVVMFIIFMLFIGMAIDKLE